MKLLTSLAAIALAVAPVALPAAASPVSAATSVGDGIEVTVVPSSAGVLGPDQDLVARVTVRNEGTQPVRAASAELSLGSGAAATASEVTEWLTPSDDDPDLGGGLASAALPDVPAGATRTVEVTVPAADLPRLAAGAHPLAVRVLAGGSELAQARSVVVWAPEAPLSPVRVVFAAALSTPATETGIIDADDLALYTSDRGLLTRQLDALVGTPVAIGVDPMILASIRLLGDSAPASALEWLERLEAAPNETFPLAYADTDVAAALQAGRISGRTYLPAPESFAHLLDPADFPPSEGTPEEEDEPAEGPVITATPTPTATPSVDPTAPLEPDLPTTEELLAFDYTLDTIAWPAEGTVETADVAALAGSGLTPILGSDDVVRGGDSSSGAAAVVGESPVLIADADVSALVREAALAPDAAAYQDAMARLSGSLAAVAQGSTGDGTVVLATMSRGWPLSTYRLGQVADGVDRLDQADAGTLSDALRAESEAVTVIDSPNPPEKLQRISGMIDSEAQDATFATVADDPSRITADRRLQVLGLLGQAWNPSPDSWATAVDRFLVAGVDLRSSVQLLESSDINLFADRSYIYISVENRLDQPVTAFVSVTAQTALVRIEQQRVEVQIEPGGGNRAQIPVESLSNGTVQLRIELSSATGAAIGSPTFAEISVNAGWEGPITTTLIVVVAGLFGLGLYRDIRKRLRSRAESGDAGE